MEVERTPWYVLVPLKCLFLILAVLPCILLKDIEYILILTGPTLALSCNLVPNIMHLRALSKLSKVSSKTQDSTGKVTEIRTVFGAKMLGKAFSWVFLFVQIGMIGAAAGLAVLEKLKENKSS